jgi:hypothetical protein
LKRKILKKTKTFKFVRTSMASFGVPTAYDRRLLAMKKKKEAPVTLLNVSRCSVPRICDEIRLYGQFDDSCEKAWKQFKEIETSLWLADHRQREADKANPPTVETEVVTETKEKSDKPPANRGNHGPSKYGGTVPLTDWAWTAIEDEKTKPESALVGLSFQDIQNYSLFELRQSMKKYNIETISSKSEENYKACEGLLAKLVQLLADPKAKKVEQKKEEEVKVEDELENTNKKKEGESEEETTKEGFVLLESPKKEKKKKLVQEVEVVETGKCEPGYELSSDGKKVRVRRGNEITYDNCPTLSLYELRQELVRRKSLDDFSNGKLKINFNNMLRRLQSLLLQERQIIEEQRADSLWEKPEDIKARLLKTKAERKAEALRRSQIRQEERNKEAEKQARLKEEIGIKEDSDKDDGEKVESINKDDSVDTVEPALWEKKKSRGLYY